MTTDTQDNGLAIGQLWTAAWVLGLVAVASVVRLVTYAAGDTRVQAELFVWVLMGAVAAAFSACCGLLAGTKSGEQRLSRRIVAQLEK